MEQPLHDSRPEDFPYQDELESDLEDFSDLYRESSKDYYREEL